MSRPLFIYVHGFNSSPESIKATLFGDYLRVHSGIGDYEVPRLSHWPAKAVQQLENLIEKNKNRDIVLIGSSLGGYYSVWLTEHFAQCRTVLVNPAIYPDRILESWLGESENLYTHERYTLTPQHLEQLKALAVPRLKDTSRYLLLVQTADDTLDYREAVDFLAAAAQFIQPGGSHGFDQFEDLIPAIIQFAQGQVELPEAIPLPPSTA